MLEEEEEFVDKPIIRIVENIDEEKKRFMANRKSVLLNLCVFALLTALFSIIFMYTLAKKSKQEQSTNLTLLPFHNPKNRSQLLCPLQTAFDVRTFTCVKCPESCLHCQHEFVTKCVQCQTPFILFGDNCTRECQYNQEGLCLDAQVHKLSVIDIGSELKVKSHQFIQIYNVSTQNIFFILPPLGETYTYLNNVKYEQLAEELNATIIVLSMPYPDVLQFQEVDQNDHQQEQFRFVERIIQQFNEQIRLAKIIRLIVMGDSLVIGHEFSHAIIKQDLCFECKLIITLLQIKELPIQQIKIENDDLSNLISYIYELKDIKHKETGNKVSLEGDSLDMMQWIKDIEKELVFENWFKPAFNQEVEIEGYLEIGSQEFVQMYKDFKSRSVRELRVNVSGDGKNKLTGLLWEIVRSQ